MTVASNSVTPVANIGQIKISAGHEFQALSDIETTVSARLK